MRMVLAILVMTLGITVAVRSASNGDPFGTIAGSLIIAFALRIVATGDKDGR
jgi:hypothetical protein